MRQLLENWYQRYFASPDAVVLFFSILIVIGLFTFLGSILAPVFASIVIAYLLDWGVMLLTRYKMPHWLAVVVVYTLFLGVTLFVLIGPIPLFWQQLTNLLNEMPHMLSRGQELLLGLPDKYPDLFSTAQIQHLIVEFRSNLTRLGQYILSASLSTIPSIFNIIIYLVMVPLLVYFFLMDKYKLLGWLKRYLPHDNKSLRSIWKELKFQIGNYVRGKILEIFIVWATCYIAFALMGLKYAMLISALVGFSVIIPYIGAIVVTIPVVALALFQWGWGRETAYLIAAYGFIITVDANILVPLLFSEAVALHPAAIMIAIVLFGGLWGFWGVFFAIPLASLVNAIFKAWPVQKNT